MKIQIVSTPRSGSAYLRSMLDSFFNQSENYYTISEPFNLTKFDNKIDYFLTNILSSKTTIVKNHIYDLLNFKNLDKDGYEKYVSQDWYTIALTRKDDFECTLSRIISEKTGNWDNPDLICSGLIVDSDEFFKKLSETKYWKKLLENNALGIKYDKIIYYEDLTFESTKDVLLFDIGVCDFEISKYTRQRMPNKSNTILNYEELKDKYMDFLKTNVL